MDSESSAPLDHIFASQGLVSTQSGAEWDSFGRRGAGEGCLVFFGIMRKFSEQEMGGKRCI